MDLTILDFHLNFQNFCHVRSFDKSNAKCNVGVLYRYWIFTWTSLCWHWCVQYTPLRWGHMEAKSAK